MCEGVLNVFRAQPVETKETSASTIARVSGFPLSAQQTKENKILAKPKMHCLNTASLTSDPQTPNIYPFFLAAEAPPTTNSCTEPQSVPPFISGCSVHFQARYRTGPEDRALREEGPVELLPRWPAGGIFS